jgi:hypothetical protein
VEHNAIPADAAGKVSCIFSKPLTAGGETRIERHAAIDIDRGSNDAVGMIRSQSNRHARVLRLPDPSIGHQRHQRGIGLFGAEIGPGHQLFLAELYIVTAGAVVSVSERVVAFMGASNFAMNKAGKAAGSSQA